MLSDSIPMEFVLTFVRLVTGVCLIYYGWPKIKGLKANAKDFVGMGYKPGWFWGTLIACVEFFGGIAMILGAYAEVAAALFGFQMIVGTFWKRKNNVDFTDYSYDLLLLAACLMTWRFGPGALALIPSDFPLLRWDVSIAAIVGGFLFAYLPEILGRRYRKWKG